MPVRATTVEASVAGTPVFSTGQRLRTRHLMAVETGAHSYRAAAKDHHGMWSEWSDPISFTASAFSAGATQGGIGSGIGEDILTEEPDVVFPDLSMGTGIISINRTIVSGGFLDEVRRSKWTRKRIAWNVVLSDLDENQVALFHRFYTSLNGPLTPFWFEFEDPITGEVSRHVVRFREPVLSDELHAVDRSNLTFTLVQVVTWDTGR